MNVMPFFNEPLTTMRVEAKSLARKGRVSDGCGLRVNAARSHHDFTSPIRLRGRVPLRRMGG